MRRSPTQTKVSSKVS